MPTDDAARAHALELLRRSPLIDAHNDLPWVIRLAGHLDDLEGYDLRQRHPETDTDIPRLQEGRVATQVLAAFLSTTIANPATVTLEQIDLVRRLEALYPDVFLPVRGPDDVTAAHAAGKIGSLISVEGTVGLEGSLAPLRCWHDLGVRLVTLCHNETLPWIDSATDRRDDGHGGLSGFGVSLIGEMNRIGLLIDLAHVAPHAMHKVLDVTTHPVTITHTCAAALVPHPRNTPDDVLDRIPANGGIVMATFVPEFLSREAWQAVRHFKDAYGKNRPGLTKAEYRAVREACLAAWPRSGIDHFCEHIEHFRSRVGEDHIGIGSDFYGGPNPPGLEDASKFPDLIAALVARGWSDGALAKLMGGNFLRVWRDALAGTG